MSELPIQKHHWLAKLEQILNYDFCPGANRWVYWLKHPLVGICVAAMAAGLCGLFVAPQAWLLCGGLLLVGLLGLVWPVIALSCLQASIRFEQAWCEEGAPTRIQVQVRNGLPFPVWGLSLKGGMPGEALLVSFARVSGWKTTDFVWEFVPPQRGVYPDSPIWVETGFPLGIWTARKKVSVTGEFIVLPKPVSVDAVPEMGGGSTFDEIYSDRQAGDAGDVTGTRPFREGDSLRRVHWALTARTGKLVCCERQSVLHSAMLVSLDAAGTHHSPAGPDSSLEWSIRIFAGICQELTQQGIRVTAMIGSDSFLVPAGKQEFRRLLLRLARLPVNGLPEADRKRSAARTPDISVVTEHTPHLPRGIQVQLVTPYFISETDTDHAADKQIATEFLAESHSQLIRLRGTTDIHTTFRHCWRRACHAAS